MSVVGHVTKQVTSFGSSDLHVAFTIVNLLYGVSVPTILFVRYLCCALLSGELLIVVSDSHKVVCLCYHQLVMLTNKMLANNTYHVVRPLSISAYSVHCITTTHTTPQPFYAPFCGTNRLSQCQKSTFGLYGARED